MITLGVIVGNRGFFPAQLCKSGRKAILSALKKAGIKAILLPEGVTKHGSVETLADAALCAQLFKENREKIDGVLVTLPNFGDERAVANVMRMSGLNVPILVHAFNDDAAHMMAENRRDSFCGKISVCNNLKQYGIPFSLTMMHTVDPENESFHKDLLEFAATCRVVKALRNARFGMIGARPAAFNTVRFSEKLLERAGISIETLDLSEVFGWATSMADKDRRVGAKLKSIQKYTDTASVAPEGLMRMAKLGVAIDQWMKDNQLSASAIQCWTSMEMFYGVVPCALMSMMSNSLMPSACETDITGLIGMVALQAASQRPAALLDWNNNYGEDEDKGVLFHCSNLPKDFFVSHKMDYQAIIAGAVGKDKAWGAIMGRIAAGPFSYCRVSTDEDMGMIRAYVGEGEFTDDPLETFGGYGVFQIPELQELMAYICENGFEHHVAATRAEVSDSVAEALDKYLDWDVYQHG